MPNYVNVVSHATKALDEIATHFKDDPDFITQSLLPESLTRSWVAAFQDIEDPAIDDDGEFRANPLSQP